jgi:hypothetical protein
LLRQPIAKELTLGVLTMFSAPPQLKERALADIAAIGIPRGIKEEMYLSLRLLSASKI